MGKTLVVGPWLGEFGWLLMRWQGHIRYLSKDYDKVIVCHAKNHADRHIFFADYAEPLVLPQKYDGKVDRWIAEVDSDSLMPKGMGIRGIDYISPSESICRMRDLPQTFFRYKDGVRENGWILLHARNVRQKQHGCDRNWPLEKWVKLVNKISALTEFSVAFIGSKKDSLAVTSVRDLRGLSLGRLVSDMSSAKMLVGPSSGPHHLATLCGLPSVVWSGTEKWDLGYKTGTNRERYTKGWNPFNTPVTMIDSWQPSVDEVFEVVSKRLEAEKCSK